MILEVFYFGVLVKMLIGDVIVIVKEICKMLFFGIKVYNFECFIYGGFVGIVQYDFVECVDGFVEVFFEYKYIVVEMFQQRGYFIVMMGDGVNDVLLLKKVDCGIVVEGFFEVVQVVVDIVFFVFGLSIIVLVIKIFCQIFQCMKVYIQYCIVFCFYFEIYLIFFMIILNEIVCVDFIVFIVFFVDFVMVVVVYDNVYWEFCFVEW